MNKFLRHSYYPYIGLLALTLFFIIFRNINISTPELWNDFIIRMPLDVGDHNLSNPFTNLKIFDFLNISVILFYFSTFIIGFKIIHKSFSSFGISNELTLLSSFPFGYMLLVPILRLFTFFIPISFTPYVNYFLISISFILLYKNKKNLSFSPNYLFLFFIFLILILTHSIQFGIHPFSGHGDSYSSFIKVLYNTHKFGIDHLNQDSDIDLLDKFQFFPLIRRQYDELIYNFMLASNTSGAVDPILYFWLTNSILKVSIIFLFYGILNIFNINKLISVLFIIFLYIGTISLDPRKYFLYFDSYNPLSFVVHTSRVLAGIYGPLLLAYYHQRSKFQLQDIYLLLLSIALYLPSSPIHLIMIIPYFTLLFLTFREDRSIHSKIFKSSFIVNLLILFLVGLSFATYPNTNKVIIFLLCISLLMTIYIESLFLKQYINSLKIVINHKFIFSCALIFGVYLLFSGNILSLSFYTALGIEPNYPLFERFFINNKLVNQSTTFFLKSIHCYQWAQYCLGVWEYIVHFLIFTILLSCTFYYSCKNKIYHYYRFTSITVLILISQIYLQNFSSIIEFTWVFSRYLEVSFYTICFIFLILFNRYQNKYLYHLGFFFFIWSIIPFISTHRPHQIQKNFSIFNKNYKGRDYSFYDFARRIKSNYLNHHIYFHKDKYYAFPIKFNTLLLKDIENENPLIISSDSLDNLKSNLKSNHSSILRK